MLFEDTTLLLLWFACTYAIVQITFGMHNALKETNEELVKELHQRLNDIIHMVQVEKQDGVYFWYDADDGEFLAQGRTDEEIIAVLKARFPNHIFYLPTNHFLSAKHNWTPTLAPDALPAKIDSIIQK